MALVEDFPGNSFAEKERETQTPVVTSRVTKKKRSIFGAIKDAFIDEESKNVGEYIVFDVLIPAFKDLVSDVVTNSVNMALFGDTSRRTTTRYSQDPIRRNTYTSYSSPTYSRPQSMRQKPDTYGVRRASKFTEDLIFDSKRDADLVLDSLDDMLNRYSQVSVASLYELAGLDSVYTDNKWGWESLEGAHVAPCGPHAWTIKLPPSIVL